MADNKEDIESFSGLSKMIRYCFEPVFEDIIRYTVSLYNKIYVGLPDSMTMEQKIDMIKGGIDGIGTLVKSQFKQFDPDLIKDYLDDKEILRKRKEQNNE